MADKQTHLKKPAVWRESGRAKVVSVSRKFAKKVKMGIGENKVRTSAATSPQWSGSNEISAYPAPEDILN
jgi:hypothetical protein